MKAGWRRPQPALIVALIALLAALAAPQGLRASLGGSESDDQLSPRCLPGAALVGEVCLDVESSGPINGVMSASQACAVSGGFLPTPQELIAARGTIDLGNGRGFHSQYTDSYFYSHDGTVPMTVVVSSVDSRSVPAVGSKSGKHTGAYEYICRYTPRP